MQWSVRSWVCLFAVIFASWCQILGCVDRREKINVVDYSFEMSETLDEVRADLKREDVNLIFNDSYPNDMVRASFYKECGDLLVRVDLFFVDKKLGCIWLRASSGLTDSAKFYSDLDRCVLSGIRQSELDANMKFAIIRHAGCENNALLSYCVGAGDMRLVKSLAADY
jgi:hypothetical protein